MLSALNLRHEKTLTMMSTEITNPSDVHPSERHLYTIVDPRSLHKVSDMEN